MAIKIIATVDQQDIELTGEQLGINNMDVPDDQVLDAVRDIVGEHIRDQDQQYTFAVRRAMNTETFYVYPKPGFGTKFGFCTNNVIKMRNICQLPHAFRQGLVG